MSVPTTWPANLDICYFFILRKVLSLTPRSESASQLRGSLIDKKGETGLISVFSPPWRMRLGCFETKGLR
jgi:hypothetical protein